MRELIAGVDLGGTNIRVALADKCNPEITLTRSKCKTPVEGGPSAILKAIDGLLNDCLSSLHETPEALVGIGCTVPGVTDSAKGVSLLVTNLPGWDGYPVQAELEAMLGVPAIIDNDVNAAALGEYWYGKGKGGHSIVYFTISTGVAAGIVIEGQLLRGFKHAAGEMGFFVPDPGLLSDNWEPNGCLELTSAGVGIARSWAENKRISDHTEVTAEDVFKAAAEGDTKAIFVINTAANYLAQCVIALATVIDPERIILSGSIVQHQKQIYEHICRYIERHVPHAPPVIFSDFEGDAPLIGALALIAKKLS